MKYFIDSAKMDEIKYAYENLGIDGITTNPKHIAAAGKPFYTIVHELADEFQGIKIPISLEINPHLTDPQEMVEEARKIAAVSENFVIKIACTEPGLIAAKKLIAEGIKVNVTLVFTTTQALQIGRIGATFCSPFIGWQESSGVDCTQLLQDIVTIYENYDFDTEIIVAAVRNGKQIAEAAVIGADIVTAGLEVYKDSLAHPFTDKGIKTFQDFWDQTELGEL